jgi:hypothetical protein
MTHAIRNLILFTIVSISFFFSLALLIPISEKFFFDKLYYRKSQRFGYLDENIPRLTAAIRFRMNGIDLLGLDKNFPQQDVLASTADKTTYRIAVIGDSIVWGLGIKKEQRFSDLLEKKFNTVRATTVINLGFPGDNFLDNLSKYTRLTQNNHPQDLYIFLILSNDVLLWEDARYPTDLQNDIVQMCKSKGSFAYDGNFPPIGSSMDDYVAAMRKAWTNEANVCLVTEGAKFLPDNAIYLIADNSSGSTDYDVFMRILSEQGLSVQTILRNSPGIEKYQRYFDNTMKYFVVTQLETHPSTLANRMIADYLYTEITSNDRWKFSNTNK